MFSTISNSVLSAAVVVALFCGRHADGAIIISTSADPLADLLNLSVGQVVGFDVTLSGLGDAGNPTELEFLATEVLFDPAIFDLVAGPSAGGIVPDPFGFFPVTSPGVAGAIYDNNSLFAPPLYPRIATNGVFFSFELEVVGIGASTVAINPFTTAFDENSMLVLPEIGPALDVAAIPEPASLAVWSIIGFGSLCVGWRQRRAAAAADRDRMPEGSA